MFFFGNLDFAGAEPGIEMLCNQAEPSKKLKTLKVSSNDKWKGARNFLAPVSVIP
jgi:hypothetical protein